MDGAGGMDGLDVVVTVGMGRFPFDRLVAAIEPLCAEHRVVAQTGVSRLRLPCRQHDYLPSDELVELCRRADVVITHAGNTVRLLQRMGRVPLSVARRPDLGEMADDHQVRFLELERRRGRVVAVDEVDRLPELVAAHPSTARRLLAERPPPPDVDPDLVAARLDEALERAVGGGRARSWPPGRPRRPRWMR